VEDEDGRRSLNARGLRSRGYSVIETSSHPVYRRTDTHWNKFGAGSSSASSSATTPDFTVLAPVERQMCIRGGG
jgi:hypothetical protein